MKKKLLAILLAATATLSATFGLSACNEGNSQPKWGNDYSFRAAYAQAQELGYAGTLEEFIDMISGKDGADGKDGKDGTDGVDGADGSNGNDGADGVGVKQALIDESGHLIIILTNDKELDCGEVRDIHEHEYGEWISLIETSCIQSGLQIRVCETCGYTEAKILPLTEHSWSDWQADDENDNHSRECSVCGETESAEHNVVDNVCTDCGQYFEEQVAFIAPLQGEIIKKFGMDFMAVKMHYGIDISAEEGTAVIAAASGIVENIVLDDKIDGSYITIVHANRVKTTYQFIDVNENLKVGDVVTQGDVIGTVSAAIGSEFRLGPHLHFEIIIDSEAVDPELYLDFGDN